MQDREVMASVMPVRAEQAQETSSGIACDFCGSDQRSVLFSGPDRLMGRPGWFSFVRCRTCGLLYQSPRLLWNELKTYYEGDYTAYSASFRGRPAGIKGLITRLATLKQRWYIDRFRQAGTMLDVGCGTGAFLEEMRHSGRWKLVGLEPTRQAAAFTRSHLGIPVIEEAFEAAEMTPESYDVVTLWHVLEHVMSPTQTLDKAWAILKPGGYLIFSIPNYESLGRRLFGRFWVGWDLPRHLFVFPRPVLRRMLQQHGFRIVDDRCFLISYASLGHSLTFWLQSWPATLRGFAALIRRLYYTPLTRVLLYPFQRGVERLGWATVTTWAVQRVTQDAVS